MTNEEFLIDKIAKIFDVSTEFATECFKHINKLDWKVFCSYMSDFDKPNERVEARKEFNSWLNTFNTEEEFKTKCRIHDWLDNDEFYSEKFHTMSKEYIEE